MNRAVWERRLQRIWYENSKAAMLLLPFSAVYCAVAVLRRLAYRAGWLRSVRLPVKVVVVGNLSVGGTGKTPLVIALAKRLHEDGLRVGILTRGYGGRATHWPQLVDPHSDPQQVGDEPVLLAARTGLPVIAGPDRSAAATQLLAGTPCDVLISDDGMQHYALQRDVEIALVDAARGLGNGHCLPAGPLREPAARLKSVSTVVALGDSPLADWAMTLQPGAACRVGSPSHTASLDSFRDQTVYAVAGVGNPERFFAMLSAAGLDIRTRVFADHHRYRPEDLRFGDSRPVLMTGKDAVKCRAFAQDHWWYVPVEVITGAAFDDWLRKTLETGNS